VARGYSRYFNTNGTVRDEYDNLFLLRFDADGRCAEYREWYMRKPTPGGRLRAGAARPAATGPAILSPERSRSRGSPL
jgi:hypothetical protein